MESPSAPQPGADPALALVAAQANSQEHPTLLLLSRLRTPAILEQLVRLHVAADESLRGTTYREVRLADGEVYSLHGDSEWSPGPAAVSDQRLPRQPRTADEVRRDLLARIEAAATSTAVDPGDEQPHADMMHPNWVNPLTGARLTARQLEITEAHEKGHAIRYCDAPPEFLRAYFGQAIDPAAVAQSDADYRAALGDAARVGEPAPTREEAREAMAEYLSSPQEVAERMSQLKGYFGFKADEEFTAAHLRYAREHYVADTNLDNRMAAFLDAVTPEREAGFLRLINSSGI